MHPDILSSKDPWKAAFKYSMIRYDYNAEGEELENGVKFFVAALEHLGCKTYFSCEGHPNGFYVCFSADLKLARKIASCGWFTVEISTCIQGWSIRITEKTGTSRKFSDGDRKLVLTRAAKEWVDRLLKP